MDSEAELRKLLPRHLLPNHVIRSWSVEVVDSGGLHFSSDVKRVAVIVEDEVGESRSLHLVIKQMPARKEDRVEINSVVGFKKEADFYQLAAPEYCRLQEEHGIETSVFPKFFSATNHHLVLEDLRFDQYSLCSQRLNEAHTKLVLLELAKFHATGVASKLSDPKSFHSKFAEVMVPGLRNAENIDREKVNTNFRLELSALLESMPECVLFAKSIDKTLEGIDKQRLPAPQEPYATLLHNDLWLGNILFKYSSDKDPVYLKFLDFQNTIYNSPARDIVYFLITSVDKNVLKNFESLISFYHRAFSECLLQFKMETAEFSFENLLDEINLYGPTKMKHIILLFKKLSGSGTDFESLFKKYLKEVVILFNERNWL